MMTSHKKENDNASSSLPWRPTKIGVHVSDQELEAVGLSKGELREEVMGEEVKDQIDQEKEPTLWAGRPSVRKNVAQALLVATVLIVIWIFGFTLAWEWMAQFGWPVFWVNLAFFGSAGLGLIMFSVYIWQLFWARRYRVTAERIFLHRNTLFFRQIDEIEMILVEDVKIKQTSWQRLFSVADIAFRTKSKTFRTGRFKDVPEYYQVKEIIREMILLHRQRSNVMMHWQMGSR